MKQIDRILRVRVDIVGIGKRLKRQHQTAKTVVVWFVFEFILFTAVLFYLSHIDSITFY